MKIIESDLRRWDFLANLMKLEGLKTLVEVGCKEGRTTGFVLANVPDSRVIAIDPWIVQPRAANEPITSDRETYEEWDFSKIEAEFWRNVGEHKERCVMKRMTSVQASRDVHAAVDVVFIDALHDYEHVLEDIDLWWPKVRVGGYLTGHDYKHTFPGTMRAVAERFCLMDVGAGPDAMWFIKKEVTNVS